MRGRTYWCLHCAIFLTLLLSIAFVCADGKAQSGPTTNVAEAIAHEGFWVRMTTDPIAFFTLLLVVFTGLLAVATWRLWRSTEALVIGSEKTAERQLRAYVNISMAMAKPNGETFDYYIEAKNFGQTPAYNVRLKYGVELRDFPSTSPFTFPEGPVASSAVLPPGIPMHDAFTPAQVLGPNQRKDFNEGRKAIYVIGTITYDDIFDKSEPRLTEFRYMFGGNVGIHPEGALCVCEQGNRAT